jgi:hypothetical protein
MSQKLDTSPALGRHRGSDRCPLCPQERTSRVRRARSESAMFGNSALIDHSSAKGSPPSPTRVMANSEGASSPSPDFFWGLRWSA